MAVKMSVRKTRRLRALLGKHYRVPDAPDPQETTMEDVVMAVLWEGAPAARARLAFAGLMEEFGDWNELRVSMAAEVAAVLESHGLKGNRAPMLTRILAKAVEDLYSFELERLRERSSREQRAWFHAAEGLPPYMIAAILYWVYHYDRVVVTADSARLLRRLGLVDEEATEAEIEEGLSAVVPVREAHLIYRALRQHARTVCKKTSLDCTKCRLRSECATGKARVAALEEAKAKPKARARKKEAKARKRPPATRAAKAAKKKAPARPTAKTARKKSKR